MTSDHHHELVDIITGVHKKLRKDFYTSGDSNKVWQDHIAERELREKYSSAMLRLATEVWDKKECRIEWTYNTCQAYFFLGGLERSLERERNIQMFHFQEKISDNDSVYGLENNFRNIDRKLKLLDVGSCYNPFSKYSIFSCVAIDLTPATNDVLQMDFLSLEIPPKQIGETNINSKLIFYEESFDIVIFSLVIEYLPSSELRAQFCLKAAQLLQKNGLCIIITPDSKSLHHNVPMMKSWKLAMEKIGFKRVKYEKLTHLHCMAFRKISNCCTVDFQFINVLSGLLYIPQDFKTYDEPSEFQERTEEEDQNIYEQFLELPNENLY